MTALEGFRAALADTELLANRIVGLADRFPDAADIHWGHVGDINFINERFREILAHFDPNQERR